MTRHGLDRRIALSIGLHALGRRTPATVLLGIGLSVGLVSMWISNTAATAMIYPVTMGIIAVLATASGTDHGEFGALAYASTLLLMTAMPRASAVLPRPSARPPTW